MGRKNKLVTGKGDVVGWQSQPTTSPFPVSKKGLALIEFLVLEDGVHVFAEGGG
ncbi:hypothetical protein KSB_15730 [Ktedonobacter robiniae]|uniref:Uncharacterized protein n=1 Tax=Ktedonobacter robiniae TaxID=2778365 RepID=A0ABQ3UK47_9CHLR|nr:hypothetical protein KSB_15730 [Ktedonobacter robiniae]